MSKAVDFVVSSAALSNFARYSNDKFFSIQWVKNDGSIRKATARFMPPKPGGKPATPAQQKYLLVYVMGEGYRSVRKDSILSVNAKGIRAAVKGSEKQTYFIG